MAFDWFNVVAGIATIAGLVLSVVQTLRYRTAKKHLEQLKRTRNADIWLSIATTLGAYETIEDVKQMVLSAAPLQKDLLSAKVGSVRRCIVNHYLLLLKEAVLDEDEFTENTVQDWINRGRLENEWRVAQARKFIRGTQQHLKLAAQLRSGAA